MRPGRYTGGSQSDGEGDIAATIGTPVQTTLPSGNREAVRDGKAVRLE
jgi:hypothetical protein